MAEPWRIAVHREMAEPWRMAKHREMERHREMVKPRIIITMAQKQARLLLTSGRIKNIERYRNSGGYLKYKVITRVLFIFAKGISG